MEDVFAENLSLANMKVNEKAMGTRLYKGTDFSSLFSDLLRFPSQKPYPIKSGLNHKFDAVISNNKSLQ